MRDVQRSALRLQGRHLVPRGHPDRAGADRAAQSRDEPHEGPAENSQVRPPHSDAAVALVSPSSPHLRPTVALLAPAALCPLKGFSWLYGWMDGWMLYIGANGE